MACPKCGAALADGAPACAKCGLAASAMESFMQRVDRAVPENLRTAWEAVVANWDDLAKHDAIVVLASRTDSFAWAVGQYRERVKQADPSDPASALALKQIERLRKAAEVTMYASAARRPDQTPSASKNFVAALLVLLFLVLVAVGFAKYLQARRGTPSQPWPKSTSQSGS